MLYVLHFSIKQRCCYLVKWTDASLYFCGENRRKWHHLQIPGSVSPKKSHEWQCRTPSLSQKKMMMNHFSALLRDHCDCSFHSQAPSTLQSRSQPQTAWPRFRLDEASSYQRAVCADETGTHAGKKCEQYSETMLLLFRAEIGFPTDACTPALSIHDQHFRTVS